MNGISNWNVHNLHPPTKLIDVDWSLWCNNQLCIACMDAFQLAAYSQIWILINKTHATVRAFVWMCENARIIRHHVNRIYIYLYAYVFSHWWLKSPLTSWREWKSFENAWEWYAEPSNTTLLYKCSIIMNFQNIRYKIHVFSHRWLKSPLGVFKKFC